MMIYMGSGLGFSGTLIGTVSAIGNITNLLLGIPVGYLSDRVDKKKLYAVALAVNVATPVVLLCSETPFHSSCLHFGGAYPGHCQRQQHFPWRGSSRQPITEANSWDISMP